MAKITYENKVALNQNSSIPDINKVNDTDMNMIKNVVNNNETKVLLAVSSSAPATCDTGDIYFNTTDNLIYTATATNTWGSTGVAPTQNTIYIEFSNQTLYAYDGTTLVSVGGGASGGGESLAIGTVLEFPTTDSTKVPDGWLFCDGSAVSRTTYADLFTIIGTYFGAGDGSTTFNLPTKEGLVSVGIDTNDTDFNTIGKTGGSKTDDLSNAYAMVGRSSADYANLAYKAKSVGTGTFDRKTANVGGISGGSQSLTEGSELGGTVSRLQPYTVTNYIIKATQTTPIQAEVVNAYSESESNAYSCDYVNGALDYSTDEVNTHKKWIDGKDIYRKVASFSSQSRMTQGSNLTMINILDISDIVLVSGHWKDAYFSRITNPLNTIGITDLAYEASYYKDDNDLKLNFPNGSAGAISGKIIVEYTKTTQSTRSLNTYSGDIEEKKDIVIDDGNK